MNQCGRDFLSLSGCSDEKTFIRIRLDGRGRCDGAGAGPGGGDAGRAVWLGPGMMWGWGWYGMIFGPLFMILWLAVIAVVVLIVRWLAGPWHGMPPSQTPPGRTALDILKERFARGEIDNEEYEERRRLLGS
jgi:putative membrane protein